MAIIYTSTEINEALLRAKRAMVLISEKINGDFSYLYSKEYDHLKSAQYDIYTLYRVVSREKEFITYTFTPDTYTQNFYLLVEKLTGLSAQFDSFGDYGYDTINTNYQNVKLLVRVAIQNGISAFTQLDDTPSTFAGQGGKQVFVKQDETGLEFIQSPTVIASGNFKGEWSQEDAEEGLYDNEAFVSHISKMWKSLKNNNTVEPSLSATEDWEAQSVENFSESVLTEDIISDVTEGGIVAGQKLSIGTTLTNVIKAFLTKVFYPEITAPSFAIAHNAGTLRKVGTTVNVTLSFTFNRGSIFQEWNSTEQNKRAGAATQYIFQSTYLGDDQIVTASPFAIYTDYPVQVGLNSFQGNVTYAAGAQPKDSKGVNYLTPLAGGTSAQQSTSFEGVYPIYATTSAIATLTEQVLYSMISGNNIELTLVAETGGNKQSFWLPDTWTDSRLLASVQYFNAISNQFDTTNKISDFTVSAQSQGGVAGKKYTNTTSDRGSLKIRLIF